MANDLIQFWKEGQLSVRPFVHCKDREHLEKRRNWSQESEPTDFDAYIGGSRFSQTDNLLHLSLYPVPYVGDLKRAKVIILLLNPGFYYSDYWAECQNPEFRKRIKGNLKQDFRGIDFPFMFLDPQLCWSSGFRWWEGKLRGIAREIAEAKFEGRYSDALRYLSRRLACIELFPYHSSSFGDQNLLNLPSAKTARAFVQENFRGAAERGDKTLIVARCADRWGFKGAKNRKGLIFLAPKHARGSNFGTDRDCKRAILRRLLGAIG